MVYSTLSQSQCQYPQLTRQEFLICAKIDFMKQISQKNGYQDTFFNWTWLSAQIKEYNKKNGTRYGSSRRSICRYLSSLRKKIGLKTYQDKTGGTWSPNVYEIPQEWRFILRCGARNYAKQEKEHEEKQCDSCKARLRRDTHDGAHTIIHKKSKFSPAPTRKRSGYRKRDSFRFQNKQEVEAVGEAEFSPTLWQKLKHQPYSLRLRCKLRLDEGWEEKYIIRALDQTFKNTRPRVPGEGWKANYFDKVLLTNWVDWQEEERKKKLAAKKQEEKMEYMRQVYRDGEKARKEREERRKAGDKTTFRDMVKQALKEQREAARLVT